MFAFTECIIKQMLDFYKRIWQIFIPVFGALLVGVVGTIIWLDDRWYMPLMAITLTAIAIIFLAFGLISLINDFKDSRRREKEAKAPSVYEERGLHSL